RRLGGRLSRLRRRAALVRGLRARAAGSLPGLRRPHAAPLSRVRHALQLRVRGRLRGVRRAASPARAARAADQARVERPRPVVARAWPCYQARGRQRLAGARLAEGRLVGREGQLAAVQEFLSERAGSRALLVTGEPGIGKTSIWEVGLALAGAAGMRVLKARATEPEAQLSYVALADLLEEVESSELAGVPAPQRRALEVAVLRTEPGEAPLEQFAVAAGFTAALRLLSARGPLLIAVDDVPWLDRSSAEAITFAARRLAGRPVAFLLARRPGKPSDLERV